MSGSENLNSGPVIQVVALALRDVTSGQVMLARRGPQVSGAGHWEFPGGKIEAGETEVEALRREVAEELGFDISGIATKFLGENFHQYGHRNVLIKLFLVEVEEKPTFKLVDHDAVDWFDLKMIKNIDLSSGDKPFISLVF